MAMNTLASQTRQIREIPGFDQRTEDGESGTIQPHHNHAGASLGILGVGHQSPPNAQRST